MKQKQTWKLLSGRKKRALAAAALVGFSGTAAYVAVRSLYFDNLDLSVPYNGDDHARRKLSKALPDGGCVVTYAHLAKDPIAPTWQASFPGSGSRMTWSLVEALTGIRTNDDYDSHSRGYERVVAVKTHYPLKDARNGFHKLDARFGRAIVILRNPINVIPSYFNLQYEHLNHLPNHSARGPNEDWLAYRDHPNYGLAVQIANYEKFVDYWMQKYDRQQILLISYEDMTDRMVGPLTAGRIAQFLGEVEGVDPIGPEAVPCVWETIVNYKNAAQHPGKDQPEISAPPLEQQQEVIVDEVGPPPLVEDSQAKNNRNNGRNERDKEPSAQEMDVINADQRLSSWRNDPPDSAAELHAGPPDGHSRRKLGILGGRTHAEPSSLRVGPKERPYTSQNLADLVNLFQRLAGKYSNDKEFMRIMSFYIGTVSITVPVE